MTENNDMNKYLFINLATMLSMSVMQQLGKLVNPAAGKAEINLDAAQATIDTLDMLAAKTKGNLDKDEERIMQETLAMLKMNFVETKEMQKAEGRRQNKKPREPAKPEEPENAPSEHSAQQKTGTKPSSEQPKDAKFHKSYT
ncbi:MAG: DUF1844 domain-containing protein [Kiritimatiellia bacterium]